MFVPSSTRVLALGVLLAFCACSTSGVELNITSRNTESTGYYYHPWPKGEPSFFHDFRYSRRLPESMWSSGPWANGQPFNAGFDPSYYFFTDEGLKIKLEQKQFQDPGSATGGHRSYDYTSGEVRSVGFYGYGCYSTCMKASLPSGTSTSFYVHNGPYDTPSDAGRYYNDHNEIDVEFIGKDTTKVQTNYFSRPKIAGANSGSGNEELHDLGFDAAKEFAAYSFKWTHGNIDWFVNGRRIRSAYWQSSRPVPLQSYSTVRFVANIWPVNKQAEEWAGPLDRSFQVATGAYQWMRYDEGENCQAPAHC